MMQRISVMVLFRYEDQTKLINKQNVFPMHTFIPWPFLAFNPDNLVFFLGRGFQKRVKEFRVQGR